MFDVVGFVERALEQQKNMQKIFEKQLQSLPTGNLSVYQKNGKNYYLKYENGDRFYLGREQVEEVTDLKKRRILSEMVSRMQSNEHLMEKFLEKYRDPSPACVMQSLEKAYQLCQVDLFSLKQKSSNGNWGEQPYKRSDMFSEHLTQKTLKGDFVRSKSEVIIANTYFIKGIQYRYEEITRIGNKHFAPDFKVLVLRENKIKYHEHFGMMNDPEYREKAMQKIDHYIGNGYRPYEDILFTFDNLDGSIDAKVLDQLITTFMM